ncbi:hypothetical protein M9H77_34264 [Catharanthus roseus]|uniref:Uncharacterized protein n=1 Tax=Catharanthus roseus TaxID=4058 RepID=A0ACB9ZKR8_CATRO|nr:hypothetical protein M9H77_34264 [Catharanthus roseus]
MGSRITIRNLPKIRKIESKVIRWRFLYRSPPKTQQLSYSTDCHPNTQLDTVKTWRRRGREEDGRKEKKRRKEGGGNVAAAAKVLSFVMLITHTSCALLVGKTRSLCALFLLHTVYTTMAIDAASIRLNHGLYICS